MRWHEDSSSAEGEGLYRRLVWLTLLRIALVTLLLVASALVMLRWESDDLGTIEQILYGVIVATYLASLVYLLLLRGSAGRHHRLAYAEVSGDVLIAACLVYLTGGAESILVFMFPLTVVSAAILLYRRGAVVAATLSSAGLLTVTLGLNLGLLPAPNPAAVAAPMPVPRLLFFLFAHVSAIFLTAALASYLAEQVRSTRERLTLREHDYLALELLHESIVRSIASGIVTADRFGRIIYFNPAAGQLVGLSKRALGDPVERHLPGLAGQLHGEVPMSRLEADHPLADGARRRLGFAITPLLDRDAKNHGWVVALEDLTSIRAMEEAVKRSERLAALGSMAAGLAHELRNPLASMSGSVQLLAQSRLISEEERRLMQIVLREADRLNALVGDILQFARPQPAQMQPVDLPEVIESAATLFRHDPTRRARLQVRAAGELQVMGDPRQLNQVLWNLLANAADATPEGGVIEVCAERQAGGEIELRISDQGQGIAAEDLPRIFDPFYSTKERGTGLGLAIVHSIVNAHGGQISADSEPGKGATFRIRLPPARQVA